MNFNISKRYLHRQREDSYYETKDDGNITIDICKIYHFDLHDGDDQTDYWRTESDYESDAVEEIREGGWFKPIRYGGYAYRYLYLNCEELDFQYTIEISWRDFTELDAVKKNHLIADTIGELFGNYCRFAGHKDFTEFKQYEEENFRRANPLKYKKDFEFFKQNQHKIHRILADFKFDLTLETYSNFRYNESTEQFEIEYWDDRNDTGE